MPETRRRTPPKAWHPWINSKGDLAALGDGTPFPAWAEVALASEDPAESPVRLRIELEDGQPVLTEITVGRRGPSTSILSSTLRVPAVQRLADLTVSAIVEQTFTQQILRQGGIDVLTSIVYAKANLGGDPELASAFDAELEGCRTEATRTRRRYSINRRFLQEVADIYNAAEKAPTRAVSEHFRVTRRNAARWVALARENGQIPAHKEEDPK